MAIIEWGPSFETGIDVIDYQHQKLVNILNNLADAIHSGSEQLVIEFTIDQLIDYTVYHFESEEKLMKQVNFLQLKEHIQMHEKLKARALEYKKLIESGEVSVGQEVLSFLKEWLTQHIQKHDMAYASDMKRAGIS